MSIISCIKSLIKRGKTTLPGNDSGVIQTVQAQYMNKTTNVDIINPAGFGHNPVTNSLMILFNVGGVEDNIAGIVTDQLNRIKNLQAGETIIYNTVTKSFVYMKVDGSIELFSQTVININAPEIIIDGNVTVTGNLQVDGQTNLGIGGAPIARVGDSVLVGSTPGTITSGSPNNNAN